MREGRRETGDEGCEMRDERWEMGDGRWGTEGGREETVEFIIVFLTNKGSYF